MQSARNLLNNRYRSAIVGLLAMAAFPVAADTAATGANGTYTWSAELVALDKGARTITVQAPLVSDAELDADALEPGDRMTLTWSGINSAAGVRRIDGRNGAPANEQLTLPVEFVSTELDDRYVRFKVAIPQEDVARLSEMTPGQYVTAESPRRAMRWEEAVADVRPYNDVR